MAKLLLDHIDVLATMDDSMGVCGRELTDAAILIEDGVIIAVDKRENLITESGDAEIINLS